MDTFISWTKSIAREQGASERISGVSKWVRGMSGAELPIVLMVLKHRAPRLRGAPHPLTI